LRQKNLTRNTHSPVCAGCHGILVEDCCDNKASPYQRCFSSPDCCQTSKTEKKVIPATNVLHQRELAGTVLGERRLCPSRVKGGHAEQVAAAAGSLQKAALLAAGRDFGLGPIADSCTVRKLSDADRQVGWLRWRCAPELTASPIEPGKPRIAAVAVTLRALRLHWLFGDVRAVRGSGGATNVYHELDGGTTALIGAVRD
jgi:hypothetical protein